MKRRFDEDEVPQAPADSLESPGTPSTIRAHVTDQQRVAIDLLIEGRKSTEVAKQVGVSREQLWRWRTQNPAFIAELDRVRAEVHGSRVDRFLRLVDKSLEVIEDSLDEGDPQAATDVLKIASRSLPSIAAGRPDPAVPDRADVSTSVVETGRKALMDEPSRHQQDDQDQTSGHPCPNCPLVARSAHGLRRHQEAKHKDA
jgi:transposase-like protein